MKKNYLNVILLSVLFLILNSNFCFSQNVAGKIFSKEEADKLFGPVLQFVKIPASQFESLLSQSGDCMMFRYEDKDLYILGSGREFLFGTGPYKVFSGTDVMKLYSALVIKELLYKGQSDYITVERRQNVMSVTDGDYTMEQATDCPPNCIW